MKLPAAKPPVCLSIAGLDPSGGAGVIADIRTFSAFGCFATAAVTSLTFQNTTNVFGAAHQTADAVRCQIEPILEDLEVAAVKTGMLPTVEIIETVAAIIRERGLRNMVVDPVVRSTSGYDLIDDAALRVLIALLFPLADLVTPNLLEAMRISGIKIQSDDDMTKAAAVMHSMGARNVLIKGGHDAEIGRRGAKEKRRREAVDHLFVGDEIIRLKGEFIDTTSTHGTGCTLSSAIAANLALGHDLNDAVRISKEFVTDAIRNAPGLGRGNGPIDHLVRQKR